jgi:hypothetical protein
MKKVTAAGLWMCAGVAVGQVCPVAPMQLARYGERVHVIGKFVRGTGRVREV